uniref:Uncharacterized protein n=1 Tax=Triticum urartu TaxID=4572 RepID=A0A8R7RAQ1_TRIUA
LTSPCSRRGLSSPRRHRPAITSPAPHRLASDRLLPSPLHSSYGRGGWRCFAPLTPFYHPVMCKCTQISRQVWRRRATLMGYDSSTLAVAAGNGECTDGRAAARANGVDSD